MFCNDESVKLYTEFIDTFGELGDTPYERFIGGVGKSLRKLTEIRHPDTVETMFRIRDYLKRLARSVESHGRTLYRNKEIDQVSAMIANWLIDKSVDFNTWKRIDLIRYEQAEKRSRKQTELCLNGDNVVAMQEFKKAV